jgi:hypothetical protein
MSELSELVNKIKYASEMVQSNFHSHDYKTRPGMELQRQVAKKDLVVFSNQFKELFTKTVTKIFVSGASKENLNTLAGLLEKEKLSVFHASSVYENIADTVRTRLSAGNLLTTPAFMTMNDTVKMLSNHFMVYPATTLVKPVDTVINDNATLVDIVRQTVRAAFGDELFKCYAYEQIFKLALDSGFDNKMAVVLVSQSSVEEKNSLLGSLFPGSPTFSVDLEGEVPTRAHALKLLQKITHAHKELKNDEKGQ